MKKENDYTVIITGAGPTGLMLACELRLRGVSVALFERRAQGTTGASRAPGIHARTMEILAMRGLATRFKDAGTPLPFVLFSGLQMHPQSLDPGWPDGLILPQHQTERFLLERALALGVSIHWSTELLYFKQDEDQVSVFVQQQGSVKAFSAAYLAGCDGGNSVVRKLCGETFSGDDPLSHWLVADVQLDTPPSAETAFGRNLRIGTYQVTGIEGDWYRVSLLTLGQPRDRYAPVTLDELRQAMIEGIGTDFGLRAARWLSRFGDSFRQVNQYRYQRVFLLGDAAHTHSPIGGQGLNLGIQDAFNLGWKLALVTQGHAPDSLLDTFNTERHEAGAAVLQIARAQTALIKPGSQIEALRELIADIIQVPEVTLRLSRLFSGLGFRYSWAAGQHPLMGQRVPDFGLIVPDGVKSLYEHMQNGRPVLLHFGAADQPVLPASYAARIDQFEAVLPADEDVLTWQLPVTGAVPACTHVLIRPDGVVAWAQSKAAPDAPDQLYAALQTWLG